MAHKNRQEDAKDLLRATPLKCNLLVGELSELKDLREDESILGLPADKGCAMVGLNSKDSRNKIQELLDTETYRKLT